MTVIAEEHIPTTSEQETEEGYFATKNLDRINFLQKENPKTKDKNFICRMGKGIKKQDKNLKIMKEFTVEISHFLASFVENVLELLPIYICIQEYTIGDL